MAKAAEKTSTPENYAVLDDLKVWEANYSSGDIGAIYQGILKFGFNNTPRVWKDHQIRAGNHSVLALRMVQANHHAAPKHVIDRGGIWYIPILDISYLSESEALAFAISDNALAAHATHDETLLIQYLRASEDEGLLEVTGYDTEDLATMIAAQLFEAPQAPEAFPTYDETIDTQYCCPKCGYKWSGKPNSDV